MNFREYSPLVSVVIPCYNTAHFISDAIRSVLNQSYQQTEIIVVDDGSIDNLFRKIAQYGDKVTYIYQENGGPSAARNEGIRHAKGEFIAFLDSDDAWLPLKLEKQLKLLTEDPRLCLIGTGYFNCDENMHRPIEQKKIRLAKTEREEILIRNLWPTPSLLIKKTCFDAVGMFNEEMKFAEDWDMWIRITQVYPTATLNEPLVLIRKHSKSLAGSASNNNYNYDLWKKTIHSNRKRFSGMNWVTYRKAMSFYFFNLSFACEVNRDLKDSQKYLLISLLYWPFIIPKRAAVLIKRYFATLTN